MILDNQIAAVRHILDEEDPSNTHWSPERITLFLNDVGDDAAMRIPGSLMPKLGKIHSQHLSNGVRSYSFTEEYIKIDFIRAYSRDAKIGDPSDVNALSDNPALTPSEKYPWVLRYGQEFEVYPTPTELVTNGLKIYYTEPPTPMVEGNDVPDLPQFAHTWMVLEAASKCLQEDGIASWESYHNQYLEKFDRFKVG